MYVFRFKLPETGARKIAARRLTVQVGDRSEKEYTIQGEEELASRVSEEMKGFEGETISGSLVDIDEENKESSPNEFGPFILTNTLAPSDPGVVGVELLREVADEDLSEDVDPEDSDLDPSFNDGDVEDDDPSDDEDDTGHTDPN